MTTSAEHSERIFEAVVHTYEGDDHLVPEDLREASFVKRARRYRESLASQPEGWQPIASAPEDGSWFLAWGKYSSYEVRRMFRDAPLSTSVMAPTHWRPLPPAPTDAAGPQKDEQ